MALGWSGGLNRGPGRVEIGSFRASEGRRSEVEEVLEDLATVRVCVVEEFRVKLHTKNGPFLMLHCLN